MSTVLERFAEILLAPGEDRSGLVACHLLDTLGAWYAGTRTAEKALLDRLAAPGRVPVALGVDPLDQLALRVATIRNTEIDDIHMESCTTPGSLVVPVALTLAAALKETKAKDFARALTAGY